VGSQLCNADYNYYVIKVAFMLNNCLIVMDEFLKILPGVTVMITIFLFFDNFGRVNWRFVKNQCCDKVFLPK
jgi:hypothetical protein